MRHRVSINMNVKQRVLMNTVKKESLWDVSETNWCNMSPLSGKEHFGVEENLFSLLRILRWVWCPFFKKASMSALNQFCKRRWSFKRTLPRGIIGRRCPRVERGNERGSETFDLLRKVINVSFPLVRDSRASFWRMCENMEKSRPALLKHTRAVMKEHK